MSEPKLIIKQQKSTFWYLGLILFIVGLLVVSYSIGRYLAFDERQGLFDKLELLERKLDNSQQAYQEVNQNLVMQTQSAKVDDQSSQRLVDNIKQLQDTQLQLEEELKFYRSIMAPELTQEGLTIADFEMNQKSKEELPKFKLVLIQAGKQEQFLKGKVEIKINGLLNGELTSFTFSELGTFQSEHFQFQFKYFQNIEGEIELPYGFVAKQVSIVATTQGLKKNQAAEKIVAWSI